MKDKLNNVKDKIFKNKNNLTIAITIIVFIFTFSFFLYNLNNPTRFNKLFASVIEGEAPANSAFKDKDLYYLVVDAYNSEHGTSRAYTDNLSDDELASITNLENNSCGNIVDTSGIEKLTGLTNLKLSCNNYSNIDLSNNINLIKLDLSNNQLSNIDLSQNVNLTDLELRYNKLSSIDLSNNINLIKLDLSNNQLSNIDLSKNSNLTYLELGQNQLSSIDLSHNVNLNYLSLRSNQLNNINLSQNTNLNILFLDDNHFYQFEYLNIGDKVRLEDVINLPDNYEVTYKFNDDSLASFEDGYINILNDGPILFTVTHAFSSMYITINIPINIFSNLSSDRYIINEDNKTVYVGNDSENKIIENINDNNLNIEISGSILRINDKNNNYIESLGIIRLQASYEYDFVKDYIYIGDKNIEKFKDNIYFNSCGNNGECLIDSDGNNLLIKKDGELIHEIQIGSISSSTYDLSKKYINIKKGSFDSSKIKVSGVYVDSNVNDEIKIMHNNDVLQTFDLVSYQTNYPVENGYLYLKMDNLDKNKITCNKCTVDEASNKLKIMYDGSAIETIPLIKVSSSEYDLTKNYIYVGTNDIDDSKITITNGKVEVSEDNKLNIKYKTNTLDTYDVVKVSSSLYNLTKDEIEAVDIFNKDDIKVTNGSIEYADKTLNIKYGNDIVKSYIVKVNKSDVGDNLSTTTTTTKGQNTTTRKTTTTTKKKIVVKGSTTSKTTTSKTDTTTTVSKSDTTTTTNKDVTSLVEDKTTVYKEEIKESKSKLNIIIIISSIVLVLIILSIYLTIRSNRVEEQE